MTKDIRNTEAEFRTFGTYLFVPSTILVNYTSTTPVKRFDAKNSFPT